MDYFWKPRYTVCKVGQNWVKVFGGIACLHTFRSSFHCNHSLNKKILFRISVLPIPAHAKCQGSGFEHEPSIFRGPKLKLWNTNTNKPEIFAREWEWQRGKMGGALVLHACNGNMNPFFPVHDLQRTHWLLKSLYASLSPFYSVGNDWLTSEVNENTSIAINFFYHAVKRRKRIKSA